MTEISPEDSQAELEDAKQNCMEVALQEAVKEHQLELAELTRPKDKIRQGTNADHDQAKVDLELGLEGVRKAGHQLSIRSSMQAAHKKYTLAHLTKILAVFWLGTINN